ncbi:GPN-loop GTPase 3 isoform X3 [Magallana gigas]|uniref:GPN-loop GTPase 3 isoform X3 n=1 Tax=Magallana gigas TaxID=29159 RepID=UPI00333EB180
MPRYGQLVMGPAGSGKSTYCSNMVKHAEMLKRTIHVVNLDPAAEYFDYPVLAGQIELYTHIPVMRQLVETLQKWDFRICGVFLVDSQFMIEPSKFISGILTALSTMVNLEIPHVNVMTKIDLLSKKAKKELERYLEPELPILLAEEFDDSRLSQKFKKLNSSIAKMIDDYSLVKFLPMDISDEDTINDVLIQIDTAIQYGEDFEPKEIPDMLDPEEGGDPDSGFDG